MNWKDYSSLKTAKKVAFSKEKETIREEGKEVKESDGYVTSPEQAKEIALCADVNELEEYVEVEEDEEDWV